LAEMFEGNTYSHPLILYWNSSVRLGFFLITTYMLAQLKTRFSLEEKLATTDSLTNIPNRRMFYQVVQAEIVRSGRTGRPFTVAYVDLDKFKLVNDRFGHHAGDELLRIVAQTLQAHVRRLDTTARLGGDEFTILLPELDREAARELLPRLKALVSEAIRAHGWPVTVSLGAVTYLLPPPDVDTILSRADGMMYSAKKDGGDEIYYDVYPGSVEEQPRPGPVIG
ncbi:MAG TPA: GGDEF domain-containing protein, partial [Nitrospiria bacterium]